MDFLGRLPDWVKIGPWHAAAIALAVTYAVLTVPVWSFAEWTNADMARAGVSLFIAVLIGIASGALLQWTAEKIAGSLSEKPQSLATVNAGNEKVAPHAEGANWHALLDTVSEAERAIIKAHVEKRQRQFAGPISNAAYESLASKGLLTRTSATHGLPASHSGYEIPSDVWTIVNNREDTRRRRQALY